MYQIKLLLAKVFSIIAQVSIEMRALWLVEDYVISCYNYPARGDYNTEALMFKIATARFLDVLGEETSSRGIFADIHFAFGG